MGGIPKDLTLGKYQFFQDFSKNIQYFSKNIQYFLFFFLLFLAISNGKIAEFEGYFQKYGEIEDIAIIGDKKTKEPRGFGFVTYRNLESVDQVIADYESHSFKEKWVIFFDVTKL